MKTKTPLKFEHRFAGGDLQIDLPGAQRLAVPLGLTLNGKVVATRSWKVRQGGAQSRCVRGGGFVAVDFRREGEYFHWRSRVEADRVRRVGLIDRMDVAGWTVHWPGAAGPVAVDGSTTLRYHAGASDGFGDDARPKARWLYFEPTPAHGSNGTNGAAKAAVEGAVGWMVSCAGPAPCGGVEFVVEDGRLSVAYVDFDNRASGERIEGPYLAPALSSIEEAADLHARLTAKEGYWRPVGDTRPWWAWPTLYLSNSKLDRIGDEANPATVPNLIVQLDALARRFSPEEGGGAILALDTGWCDAVGDWNPQCPGLFDDFAEWIEFRDAVRARGHKIVAAFPPFLASPESALKNEQPWHLAQTPEGQPLASLDGDFFLDYSLRSTRESVADTVHYLLEEDEEALGFDGLVLEPLCGPPNGGVAWNDPTWAVGENLWARALHLVATQARAAKTDALLEYVAEDPYASRAGNRARFAEIFGLDPQDAPELPAAPPAGLAPERLLPGVPLVRLGATVEELVEASDRGPVGLVAK